MSLKTLIKRLPPRSEEHTSELQSREKLVCRLLLEKKNEPDPALSALAAAIRNRPVTGLPAQALPPPPALPADADLTVAPPAPPRASARSRAAEPILCRLLLAAWSITRFRGRRPTATAHALVILPFRVAGADPALQYLREGMVDLLTAKLTGVDFRLCAVHPDLHSFPTRRSSD